MTVQYLEEKIQDMESVQKTILLRLENIEQLIRERDAEKQTEHTHEHSWYHHDDGFNDSEYWQSHTIHLPVPLHLTLNAPNLSTSLS